MKYANLSCQSTEIAKSMKMSINIGDNLQFITIDYLYQLMGIKQEEIVKITISEIRNYEGECLILPLNWAIFDPNYMNGNDIEISDKIIPVFLAGTLTSSTFKESYLNEHNIRYLHSIEPIGCRDEFTFLILKSNGINAYLNGCMTVTLPRYKQKRKGKYTLLIDTPIDVLPYIPKKYLDNVKCYSQQVYFDQTIDYQELESMVRKRYIRYFEDAALVVTSRLHVASPCMAAGIPVIFCKDVIDNRFSWFDQYMPLYDRGQYSKINWEPTIVEYEDTKKRILSAAEKRLSTLNESFQELTEISDYYVKRENARNEYVPFKKLMSNDFQKIQEFLHDHCKRDDTFQYCIWGINDAAENLYEVIQRDYPNAVIKAALDKYRRGYFHEISIISPDDYQWDGQTFIFVLPVKACAEARNLFEKKKIPQWKYICNAAMYIQEEDLRNNDLLITE